MSTLFQKLKFQTAEVFSGREGLRKALVLLPMVLCLFLFFAVRAVTNGMIQTHAEQTVTQFYIQSSSMMREMRLYSEALVNDAVFSDMVNAGTGEKTDALGFCEFLRDSMRRSPYINHVYVVNDRTDAIYSDEGYFSRNSLDAILSRLGVAADASLGNDLSEDAAHFSGSMAPFTSVPIGPSDSGEIIGFAIVTLNTTEFLRNFYLLDASLCCVFNGDFCISSYPAFIAHNDIDWEDSAAVSRLLGEKVTCVYRDTPDYTYMVAISNADYNKPLHVILLSFLVYAAAVAALQLISLRQTARRRRREIGALVDILPEYSGDTEFTSVVTEVKTRLREHQEQKATARQAVQERNLRYLLYGHSRRAVSEAFLRDAGLPQPFRGHYYVVNFRFSGGEFNTGSLFETGERRENDELLRLVLRSAIESQLNDEIGFTSCGDVDSMLSVFWSDSGAPDERVGDICKSTTDLLLLNYNVSIRAAISGPWEELSALAEAFNHTRSMLEFSMASERSEPQVIQQTPDRASEETDSDFLRQEQILINTVLAQKYRQIPEMVRSMLERGMSPPGQSMELTRSRLRTVANILMEAVLATGLDSRGESVVQQFRSAKTMEELAETTERYFKLLSTMTEESETENRIVHRACNYISENIGDHNLNVSAICEAVDVSAQRLTRMFRNSLDTTIAEYMNARRVERAKILLREKPSASVAEVAEVVGYNNTHSLTRNFRKLEGLTPSEYRDLRL